MSTGSNANTTSNNNTHNTNEADTKPTKTKLNNTTNASTSSITAVTTTTTSASTTVAAGGAGATAGVASKNHANNNYNGSSNGSLKNRGPGRPSKKSMSTICTWCAENKSVLNFILPTQSGKKEFCSEACIAEFRKAYRKGSCQQCDNAIRDNAPNRDFCSTFCQNKYQRRNGSNSTVPANNAGSNGVQTTASGRLTSSTTSSSSTSSASQQQHNNNNVNNCLNFHSKPLPHAERGSTLCCGTPIADHEQTIRSLQCERFHVFNWADYLNVDQLSNHIL